MTRSPATTPPTGRSFDGIARRALAHTVARGIAPARAGSCVGNDAGRLAQGLGHELASDHDGQQAGTEEWTLRD